MMFVINLLMTNSNLLKSLNNSLTFLPTPSNISFMWNFGSMLGMCLMIQIITGFLLSMYYCANIDLAFYSTNYIYRNVNNGWLMRIMHSNGASFFFICLYMHIGRNIYYESYMFINTWSIGVTIFLLTMMTAFMGYVLPWGQMSFWGATVITNLLSAIPFIGNDLTQWIWGGFTINNVTLSRFYSLHFILPFIIMMFSMIHLMFLHHTGSSNPLMISFNLDKISFHPYFTYKDTLTLLMLLMTLMLISLKFPFLLGDPDNFILANPLSTPPHIQPEWYFLFAYAILRSIPNKLGGVIALLMSILILYFTPLLFNKNIQGCQYFYLNKWWFWILTSSFIILTFMGSQVIEHPFVILSQISSIMYFSYFLTNPLINKIWNILLS
uniref:Cytochrome b n=1 Tax=Macrostemum floridum TaxID=486976 RepID=A0A7L8XF60_9NEOP|nr:cytochrome b [Macrostemum floridum]QOH91263.1 cytochrome b [Macrostemum floridum]